MIVTRAARMLRMRLSMHITRNSARVMLMMKSWMRTPSMIVSERISPANCSFASSPIIRAARSFSLAIKTPVSWVDSRGAMIVTIPWL